MFRWKNHWNFKTMESKVIVLLCFISSALLVAYLILESKGILYILGVVCILLIEILAIFLVCEKHVRRLYYAFPFLEYGLLYLIFRNSYHEFEGIVFVLFTIRIVLMYAQIFGMVFSLLGYFGYLYLLDVSPKSIWDALLSLLSYSVFILCIASVKMLLIQRNMIASLNQKLLLQSTEMERMAMSEERNRIAEDVHNTVGHTLTTAIVSLESAELLWDTDEKEAKRRLHIAKSQLKNSLGDIRQTVRQLRYESNPKFEMDLHSLVFELVEKTKKQVEIDVHMRYDLKQPLLSLQNYVIYNVVKESMTNAIKHANVQEMNIEIIEMDGIVLVRITNDGVASKQMREGFGLQTMRESIEALGGRLQYAIDTKNKSQFELCAYLPIADEVRNESNSGDVGR